MSFKYLCNHCDYSSCTHPVVNHILEHHTDKIEDYKLNSGLNGNLISMYIRTEKSNDPTNIFCCFGCKKFWGRQSIAEKHKKACLKKQEHVETIINIKKNRNTPMDETIGNKELQNKIVKLEDKIKMLEEELKEYQEAKEKYDALSTVLINYYNCSTRENIINKLYNDKSCYVPNVDWNSELVIYREYTKDNA